MSNEAFVRKEIGGEELLGRGIRDGEAEVRVDGETGGLAVRVDTPFTIWYPEKIAGPFGLFFDCRIYEKNTKMLILFCAMGNGGASVADWKREGKYTEYTAQMQTYSLGVNRGGHSGTKQFSPFDPEGRDDQANLRRLGVFGWSDEHVQRSRAELQEMMARIPGSLNWHTPTWREWNRVSTICSAEEPACGLDRWIHHAIRCDPPYVAYYVGERMVFEIVDHTDPPLREGFIGFRCMSPGKRFGLKKISLGFPG